MPLLNFILLIEVTFSTPTSIYNNLTGLRWLHKCFKSRGRQSHLGPGSWAGRTDFVHAAVERGIAFALSVSEASDTVVLDGAMP